MPKNPLLVAALLWLPLALHATERPLSIDKTHSRIEAEAKATMHAFTAKLSSYDAEFMADTTSGKIKRGTLQFKISNVKTGDEKRDRDMLAWIHNDQFPEVVFTLISVVDAAPSKLNARGQLLLHGVAKEIAFPVTVETKDQHVYSIDGHLDLDTQEFGLPIIRKYGLLKVDPVLHVSFHLQGAVVD